MKSKGRYFKSGSRSSPQFQWTEPPMSPPAGLRSKYIHYQAFNLGELTAKVGDFVLIRSTDSMNQEILDCDVARLDELYHEFENQAEPYRAVVTWLCRPDFLPAMLERHGFEEQGAAPFNNKYEVVGEARQFEKDISAETIYYKCSVVSASVKENPATISKHKAGPYPCYLHRFNMTISKKNNKKTFGAVPVISSVKTNSTKRAVLGDMSSSPVGGSGKRKTSDDAGGDSKRMKSDYKEPSLELSGFVIGRPGLDGGYWGKEGGKRTPKPKHLDYDLVVGGKGDNCGVVSTEEFTQVETTTGSGKKVTIKCGDIKKFAPSRGLVNNQISSLLDGDRDITQRSKRNVSLTPKKRARRASVSCTTPSRRLAKTPTKITDSTKKRPASETKKSFKQKSLGLVMIDSDEDFSPVKAETDSSDSEDDSSWAEKDESKARQKKRRILFKITSGPKTSKKLFNPKVAPRKVLLPTRVDPLTEAQQRLHVSAVPESLPCREEEFAEIFGYVESKLQEGTGGCCYISGVPGTGKTATVMEVIRYLQENKEDYPDFNFYAMNGMRLTSPEQAYVEMWQQMAGEKATAEHAMKLLDKRFNTKDPKRVATIFLVDELDMLCNRKQSVLYNIFDWPSKPNGKLIVIAIANTMDLPERVMMNRVSSRLGLTRQTFQPYTHTQLQTIVASRLEGLLVFEQNAIQLVARKVASLSGDARRALDICRRATEMAEVAGQMKIGVQHVTNAHMEMFSSPKILAIRSCSKYEQLVLKVMVSEFHRSGVEETTIGAVFREHQTCLRTEGLETISLVGTVAMLARLSALRLVLAEHFKFGLLTKLRLNVGMEDIDFALKKVEE